MPEIQKRTNPNFQKGPEASESGQFRGMTSIEKSSSRGEWEPTTSCWECRQTSNQILIR